MPDLATRPSIDFARVAAEADLPRIVEAVCGPPNRSGKFHCPRHDDGSPSLYLWDGDRRFRCWPCDAQGDALDFLAWTEGLDLVEAARRLDPSLGPASPTRTDRRPPPPRPEPKPTPTPAWHARDWQVAVDGLIAEAESALWSKTGRGAVAWLRSRGLDPATARRFRLGWLELAGWTRHVERPDGTAGGLRSERGILLPWLAPGACFDPTVEPDGPGRWCGANIRRLAEDPTGPLPPGEPKCKAITGSERGHMYPFPDILPSQGHPPALLVEGEFDALIGWQEAGPLAMVGTIGGATQRPHRSALLALARCPLWLVATDHDGPGIEAARQWRERAPHKARRVILPRGKDLAEFHHDGGDIRAWLASELARVCPAKPPSM